MSRNLAILFLALGYLGSTALADAMLVRGRGGKLEVVGMPDKIDEQDVTKDNWKIYVDQSTAVIGRDGYDGVELLRKAGDKKGTFYPVDEIVEKVYTTQPDSIQEAYDSQARGAFGQAIGEFRAVIDDASLPEVYRLEANYLVGICYLQMNNTRAAAAHFAKWPGANSAYTPEVHRILAEILTDQKAFDKARAEYAAIGALPDLPKNWQYKARLGAVKVDIAERKFDAAEATAKSIATEVGITESLNDAKTLALVLQAEAIVSAGNKDRLPEAQKILESAAGLTGASKTNRAYLFSTLGNTLYAQGKVEDATFPYLRVVCLYPDEPQYVANALQNAGQCFLDLAERAKADPKTADAKLISGMKLLAECARNYKGSAAASAAGAAYMKSKSAYEDAVKRQGGEGEAGSEGGK